MRTIQTAVLLGFTAVGLLTAQSATIERMQVSNTETIDFPTAGTLHMTNAVGELTIEGWDQPRMEITTIKSSKTAVDPKNRGEITKLLDSVKITTQTKGDEVLISSTYPKHSKLLRPFEGMTDFDLEYRIKVPRNARLTLQQVMGETHIDKVSGDIRAEDELGEITIHVPEGQYAIDAKSKFGGVDSDFPGTEQRKRIFGQAFMASPAQPAQKMFLRAGYGDIVILKIH